MDNKILRSSGARGPNPKIEDQTASAARQSNTAWLERRPAQLKTAVLLVGGTSLAHFRTRCAQAIMRRDLLPSYWSQVGILDGKDNTVTTVPVDRLSDVSRVPDANGVEVVPINTFDDRTAYPNIAVVRFVRSMDTIIEKVKEITPHREQLSVPVLLVRWLTYIWSIGEERNPLAEGSGIPSARWLESVFAAADVELAPGLASGASCPEAIWQAARWWYEFYRAGAKAANAMGRRGAVAPTGVYLVRQQAAAVRGPRDTADGSPTEATRKISQEYNPIRR